MAVKQGRLTFFFKYYQSDSESISPERQKQQEKRIGQKFQPILKYGRDEGRDKRLGWAEKFQPGCLLKGMVTRDVPIFLEKPGRFRTWIQDRGGLWESANPGIGSI